MITFLIALIGLINGHQLFSVKQEHNYIFYVNITAEAVSCWPRTVEAWNQSQDSAYEICGEQAAMEGFSLSNLVFSHHYHSTNTPW